ncbi:MAG: hypothetical protein ACMXYD_00205 [Candidatus Woesearchaeota archaeon]
MNRWLLTAGLVGLLATSTAQAQTAVYTDTETHRLYLVDQRNTGEYELGVAINHKEPIASILYPGSESINVWISANTLEEALQAPDIFTQYFSQATRVDNTLFAEKQGIRDAPTYAVRVEDKIYFFLDLNEDGKLQRFIDAVQVVQINKQEDNTSVFWNGLEPNHPEPVLRGDPREGPVLFYHLTPENTAHIPEYVTPINTSTP